MTVFVRCQKVLCLSLHCRQVQPTVQFMISHSLHEAGMFINGPLLFFCCQLEYVMRGTFLLSLWVWKLIFLLHVSTCLLFVFPRDRWLWVLKNVGLLDMCLLVHNCWMSHRQQSAIAPCSLFVIQFAVTDRFNKRGNVTGNVCAKLLIFLW
jgi:hypothetical protein